MGDNKKILLETGTNEVEILEFHLGDQSFGINVLKIQAIEQFSSEHLTTVPLAPACMPGSLLFRDECLPLIDLRVCMDTGKALDFDRVPTDDDRQELVMILQFNNRRTAFLVDRVERIHRVGWDTIKPLNPYLNRADTKFTGSLNIGGKEILLVDLEKIVAEVLAGDMDHIPASSEISADLRQLRGRMPIFLADDSPTVRRMLLAELTGGGYSRISLFSTGDECLGAIQDAIRTARSENRPLVEVIAGVITDIEMPGMDGLTLCRRLRQLPELQDLPVIVFSSLVNAQMAARCRQVGASDYISKPQFSQLAAILDKHLMEESAPV